MPSWDELDREIGNIVLFIEEAMSAARNDGEAFVGSMLARDDDDDDDVVKALHTLCGDFYLWNVEAMWISAPNRP